MSNLKRNRKLRWAPSFIRRQGQMTTGQKRAYRNYWPKYGLEFRHDEILKLNGPLCLEIGFGMGENLIHSAAQKSDKRFLGIEVHKPGIAATLGKIEEGRLNNLQLVRGDARLILSDHIEGRIFESIAILFPDPWPKESDFHRRLIQPGFIDLLETRLQPGGTFHFASDVVSYRGHVNELLERQSWSPLDSQAFRESRVRTKYEKKGEIEKGLRSGDLVFQLKAEE